MSEFGFDFEHLASDAGCSFLQSQFTQQCNPPALILYIVACLIALLFFFYIAVKLIRTHNWSVTHNQHLPGLSYIINTVMFFILSIFGKCVYKNDNIINSSFEYSKTFYVLNNLRNLAFCEYFITMCGIMIAFDLFVAKFAYYCSIILKYLFLLGFLVQFILQYCTLSDYYNKVFFTDSGVYVLAMRYVKYSIVSLSFVILSQCFLFSSKVSTFIAKDKYIYLKIILFLYPSFYLIKTILRGVLTSPKFIYYVSQGHEYVYYMANFIWEYLFESILLILLITLSFNQLVEPEIITPEAELFQNMDV